MSKKDLFATLKKAGLTREQRKNIAAQIEATGAIGATTAAQNANTLSTNTQTISINGLTTAIWANIKAIGAWLVTNPAGWLLMIGGAALGTKAIMDKLGLSAEGAAKKFQEAQNTYTEAANELSSLSSELETTKTRLEELQDLAVNGRLTPDQEAELSDLRKTNEELQRKYDIQKKLVDIENSNAGEAAENAYNRTKYSSLTKSNTIEYQGDTIENPLKLSGEEFIRDTLEGMKKIEAAKDEIERTLEGNSDLSEKEIKEARAEMEKLSATYAEYDTAISEAVPDLEAWAGQLSVGTAEQKEMAKSIYAAIDAWVLFGATEQEVLAHIRKEAPTAATSTANELMPLIDDYQKAIDAYNKITNVSPITGYDPRDAEKALTKVTRYSSELNKQIDYLKANDGFRDFVDECINLGVISDDSYDSIAKLLRLLATDNSASAIAEDFADLATHITTLADLEEQFNSLSEALGEFRDSKIVSSDTLKDLQEVFGSLPNDAYQAFVNVVGDSNSTFDEAQAACNRLAEAYINNKNYLGDLTEETKGMTIAQLENIGVTNASEVVEDRLAAQRVEAALAAYDSADATWEDTKKILENIGATEADIEALIRLRREKLNAKSASINFVNASASVIQSLIEEANAAGIAAEKINSLIQLENMKAQIGTGGLTGTEYLERVRSLAAKAKAEIESARAEVSLISTATITPPKVTGGNTDVKDPNKEEFEALYAAKKHELDMEKISTQEFYDWLTDTEEGYMHFFEKNTDEWRKYEKEAFDLRRQLSEDYLNDIDDEIEVLERQGDSESQIIAKYKEKQAVIKDLMEVHMAYLKSIGASDDAIANNDYLKSLLQQWRDLQDLVFDVTDTINDELADGMKTLLDMTIEIIKKEGEDAVDALEEQKDLYSEIVSQRREMLKMAEQERQYNDEVAEKTAALAKLEARIATLRLDDSREAAVERASLEEQKAELQKELAELQNDHWLDSVDAALEQELEDWENQQDSKIDEIEDMLDDEVQLRAKAIAKLDNMNDELFDDLLSYAVNYCDMSTLEFEKMWNAAMAAAEKYGSYVNAMEAVPGSDKETQAKSIIDEMNRNRAAYAASTSKSEREYYDQQNLKLGAQLAEVTGQNVYRDKNGYWWINDQYLFDYGTGTGNANSIISRKNTEKVSAIVDDMQAYGKRWSVNNTEKENEDIHEVVEEYAKSLQKYGVYVDYQPASGRWIIVRDDNDREKVGKVLYDVYHQGGVVGIPTMKQNEHLSLLERGEMILTETHQNALDKLIEFSKKVSQIPSTVAGMFNSNNTAQTISVEAPLYITGDMSETKILSVLKKHSRLVANEVAKVVNVK